MSEVKQGVQLVMDPTTAKQLVDSIANSIQKYPELAAQPILLTSPTSRRHIHRLTSRFIPQLAVLSHNELTPEANVSSITMVELAHAS